MIVQIQALVGGVIVGLPNYFILRYAKSLYEVARIEQQVNTPMGPAHTPENFQELWRNISTALTSSFLEMYVGYAAIPFFVFGLYLVFKGNVKIPNSKFWKYWVVSFLVFSCFFVTRFADHDYYINSTMPIAALFSSIGFAYLWKDKKHRKCIIILLCLAPLGMVFRVQGRWSVNKQIPEEFLSKDFELSSIIPTRDRIVVLGDKSPVNFLYFIRRKGIAEEPNVSVERIRELSSAGIHWVVVYTPRCDPSHLKSVLSERGQIGRFTVYEIKADH